MDCQDLSTLINVSSCDTVKLAKIIIIEYYQLFIFCILFIPKIIGGEGVSSVEQGMTKEPSWHIHSIELFGLVLRLADEKLLRPYNAKKHQSHIQQYLGDSGLHLAVLQVGGVCNAGVLTWVLESLNAKQYPWPPLIVS